jgi:hypothetical protein
MVWDWTVRLVLPVLVLVLAAVIYEIVHGPRAVMSGMERVAIALLAVTMLGMAGWWLASWLPSGDVPQQASQRSPGRREGSSAP